MIINVVTIDCIRLGITEVLQWECEMLDLKKVLQLNYDWMNEWMDIKRAMPFWHEDNQPKWLASSILPISFFT